MSTRGPSDMTYREKMRFLWGVYRKFDRKTREAWSGLGPSSVFVDLGANVGFISRAVIARGCEVHAIEPNPWAFDALRRAVVGKSNVTLYNFAASNTNGKLNLFLHESHEINPMSYSTGSSLVRSKPNVSDVKIEVEGRCFADFLTGLGRVDFLKIDIEGFEVELVPHLVRALDWEKIGFVAVETHDKDKWSDLSCATVAMKSAVKDAGLSDRFSWNWP